MAANDEAVGGSRWDAAGAEGALDSLSCSNTWTLTAVCFKAGASQAVGTHSEQPKECLEPKKQTRGQNYRRGRHFRRGKSSTKPNRTNLSWCCVSSGSLLNLSESNVLQL